MHIGLFIDAYHPCIDGAITAVDNLGKAFEVLGHRYTIIAPYSPHYTDSNPEQVIRVPSMNFVMYKPYRFIYPLWWRWMDWKSHGFDIIHTHSPFLVGRIGNWYARTYNAPLLFTFHTLYPDYLHYIPVIGRFAKGWAIHAMSNYGNAVDLNIAPSRAFQRLLAQWGTKKPISFLPTGLQLDKFRGNPNAGVRAQLDIPEDVPLLIFVGRIGKEKNLQLMLHCLHRLSKKQPRFRMLFIGEGQDRARLEQLTRKLQLTEQIQFLGFMTQNVLADYYRAADVFLMTSLTDNQPLVLIEAMINDTPVVGVNVLGIPDMVTHEVNGLIAEPTEDSFSTQLIRIIEDVALRQRLSEGARAYAEQQDYRVSGEKHLAIYQQMLDAKKQGIPMESLSFPDCVLSGSES
jgi:1,2-diacylglycerol 3-alpha-glucosyltransferase